MSWWKHNRETVWKIGAMSLESARDVRDRKSIWMVEYLRARRDPRDHEMLSFYRRQHFKNARFS